MKLKYVFIMKQNYRFENQNYNEDIKKENFLEASEGVQTSFTDETVS